MRPSRPWERGTADCFELGGILELRIPFVPSALETRVASWCQVAFGPAGAAPAHDLTRARVFAGRVEDVDGDGLDDLMTHFETTRTGLDGKEDQACVRLQSVDGQPYAGCDRVTFVGG